MIYKFDKDFSLELQHYLDELTWINGQLEIVFQMKSTSIAQAHSVQTKHLKFTIVDPESSDKNEHKNSKNSEKTIRIDGVSGEVSQLDGVGTSGISMSAFIKASHRLRSMSMISGYVFQSRGRFKQSIYIQDEKQNHADIGQSAPIKRWHLLMSECELRVRYSVRRHRFVLEIHSLEAFDGQQEQSSLEQSAMSSSAHDVQEQQPVQSTKFGFDLHYDLCLQMQQSSQQMQLSKQINK